MKKNKKEWYGVKCIFSHPELEKKENHNVFEERITICKARSLDKAVKKAEKEAKQYAKDTGCHYTDVCDAYYMTDELGEGSEIYSFMIETKFNQEKYLDKFFDVPKKKKSKK